LLDRGVKKTAGIVAQHVGVVPVAHDPRRQLHIGIVDRVQVEIRAEPAGSRYFVVPASGGVQCHGVFLALYPFRSSLLQRRAMMTWNGQIVQRCPTGSPARRCAGTDRFPP
jgi:hypothetical protein